MGTFSRKASENLTKRASRDTKIRSENLTLRSFASFNSSRNVVPLILKSLLKFSDDSWSLVWAHPCNWTARVWSSVSFRRLCTRCLPTRQTSPFQESITLERRRAGGAFTRCWKRWLIYMDSAAKRVYWRPFVKLRLLLSTGLMVYWDSCCTCSSSE